jgi:SAM-dependent methyltransferase
VPDAEFAAGFTGEIADFYDAHRRGYPESLPALLTALAPAGPAFDIGCGTGQLTIPLAECGWSVVGLDPSADMLAHARANAEGNPAVTFVQGTAADLPDLATRFGAPSLITVAGAFYLLDEAAFLDDVTRVLPPGGILAVVTNGVPPWLQETPSAHRLRMALTTWFGSAPRSTCGTGDADHAALADRLQQRGFRIRRWAMPYQQDLSASDLTGLLLSALSPAELPTGERRAEFASLLRRTVGERFVDLSEVRAVLATQPG